ncbi:acetate-CoA ligase [Capsaspora owczarzaki ATCC 30864]|uniref:Acetyl-coenzyme A synthetase n=1 Tax=Capsaspora owczarzaki (strain ATCC 30864) TaxID=595528 RepID=A0A0D2WTL4_CAPO3|nr:acetate-CoA ligase [Capsaspora owczarzaki ATCC 30864]KJE95860.1 acetate-CoA ligase [Capsaspora owczarzaki ATCC 30864]|eukprot:XP_004345012.1 acetate-CoA ligase [Capsaspora owczarzaki ATCC 30864]
MQQVEEVHHEAAPVFPPPPARSDRPAAHVPSMDAYRSMYRESVEDPDRFWGRIAAREFSWETPFILPGDAAASASAIASKPDAESHANGNATTAAAAAAAPAAADPTKVTSQQSNFDVRTGPVAIKWFESSRTNLAYNCLDRNVHERGLGDNVAFFWEGNNPEQASKLTYRQLLDRVSRFANVLKSFGVAKGDTVGVYMPMVVELPIAMLACARIGAIHSVMFGGFSHEAIAGRILDAKCKVIVTADGVFRGEKVIPLKHIMNKAIEHCAEQGFAVTATIVLAHLGNLPEEEKRSLDRDWLKLEAEASPDCPVEWLEAEHPLFMLYTSGSTGRPKGVVHTQAGYMVWAATTFKYVFDYHPGDVYWCTADCGWITGHSYVTYGPLLNGATSVLFEGIPTYPDAGRCWQVIDKYQVTQFYTAPTAIRALMKFGDEIVARSSRASLRILGTVGEPINPAAWLWYFNVVGEGRCPIVDTWWQTETGGFMITPFPAATPCKPGSATLPFFGVVPALIDSQGREVEGEGEGSLVIKQSWPGQMRTVFGDHKRFEETYFSQHKGYYFSGDGCRRDEDGYYWITGRIDDVLMVSGHRIGTAEVEGALVGHEGVVEAAVVGYPHDIKGEGIYAFVTLAEGFKFTPELVQHLKLDVRENIGAFASVDIFHEAPALPKTRSGKIMRRILRKIAAGETDIHSFGDTSTLADPNVVEMLISTRPGH